MTDGNMDPDKTSIDKSDKKISTRTPGDESRKTEEPVGNATFSEEDVGRRLDDRMGNSLDKLSDAFMASARRWEMVVYPSLFAFILLAVYGFYLVYSLTMNVTQVAEDMHKVSASMERVVVHMGAVSHNLVLMTQTVDSQSASMHEMVRQMQGINRSVNQIRYDMSVMNNSVSRPMSFMNNFMPW